MNFNFIKEDEEKAIFEVDAFFSINDRLIKSIKNDFPQETIVFIPSRAIFSDLETMREQVSQKYFLQLGFLCEPKNVREIKLSCQNKYKVSPLNQEGLVSEILFTYETSFRKRWLSYMGEKIDINMKNALMKSTVSNRSFVLSDSRTNKISALVLTFPSSYCLGTELEQVGWIWIDSNLKIDSRKEVQGHLTRWLKNKNYVNYQAGVHIYNKRSLNFFNKIGFSARCVHVIEK